ncbi:MAG: indole-3-glycerol phosphate synthase TrpC [Candidatus Dadabacteria bacterium]|nr:indole-3-glycerol phosphate synthase TrpC [Candidatus Dadabacteria bacterium]
MILDDILQNKKIEVQEAKTILPFDELKCKVKNCPAPKDFYSALCSKNGEIRIIAEIKKASPSKGILSADFNPQKIASLYESSGADAISVLTDSKFFKGSLDDLRAVRNTVDLPLLRKDFMIEPYQLYEAKYYGADAVLLIVAALGYEQLAELKSTAQSLGLHALVEVHNVKELETALSLNSDIIGINNRDLKTFDVSLQTSVELSRYIPDDILIISESGIQSPEDIKSLKSHGISSFLIGESLMKSEDPGDKIKELKKL